LIGIIKTELRADRRRRPIRDYDRAMYQDPQVQLEGWIYGLGYRPHGEGKDAESADDQMHEQEHHPAESEESSTLTNTEIPTAE